MYYKITILLPVVKILTIPEYTTCEIRVAPKQVSRSNKI